MRRLSLLLGLTWAASGCHVHVQDAPAYSYETPRPPPPGRPRPPRPPRPPPPSREVIEVKEIHASRVSARVIYAKEVKARDGRVRRVIRGGPRRENWGGSELKTRTVSADVIYAKEIHADWIEADEIHAKEVKLGR
ncbi:hypothetical protein [Myxococcus sp. Y35]|uniref:hypothetical protein n=1 Tax=Pseudomyxococcus flavus TaxID=3115648 RepID=UPI003CF58718